MSENKQDKQNNSAARRFIVLDIVFYGSSLNYDQGVGNYQELKKITRWDGKIHTLVSRYALRYSMLETGKDMKLWELADSSKLQRAGEGDKTVIQPSISLLLSGEILKYPEFDLFGYLITNTVPQNFREAPVKISHAISMTPYNYDSHFCGNLGLAKRMIAQTGKIEPNLFTVEEHQTYYIYTVVIDVDRIGINEVYLAKKGEKWEAKVNWDSEKKITVKIGNNIIEVKEFEKEVEIDFQEYENFYKFVQKLKEGKNERILNLLKVILNLNRSIKGRSENLKPKLLIVGCYKGFYNSYKDRIALSNEYEEIYEEEVENDNKGKIRIVRRIVKSNKPVFIIKSVPASELKDIDSKENDENAVIDFVKNFLDGNENSTNKVMIFKSPEIDVKIE